MPAFCQDQGGVGNPDSSPNLNELCKEFQVHETAPAQLQVPRPICFPGQFPLHTASDMLHLGDFPRPEWALIHECFDERVDLGPNS